MKNIFKLAMEMLFHRKKIAVSMFLTVFVSILLIFTVNAVLTSINVAKFKQDANIYGEHHAIMYDLTSDQISKVSHYRDIDSFGTATIKDQGTLDGIEDPIYFGSIDGSFKQIGHINLIKGTFPQNNQEIAVEENIAIRLGGISPGDTISADINSNKKTFRICGIIDNYTGVWNTWANGQTTNTALPQAIVAPNYEGMCSIHQIIVKFVNATQTEINSRKISELVKYLDLHNYVENVNLYMSETTQDILFNQAVCWVFSLGVALAAFLIIQNVLQFYISSSLERYHIFYCLGSTVTKCSLIFIIQLAFVILAGVAAAVVGGIACSMLITGHQTAVVNVDPYAISLSVVALISLISIIQSNRELMGKIVGKEEKQFQRTNHLKVKKSPIHTLAIHQIKLHLRHFMWSIISLGICVSIFCLGVKFQSELSNSKTINSIDFSIIAPNNIAYDQVQNYLVLMNSHQCIGWKDMGLIRNLRGINTAIGKPFVMGTVMEFSDNGLDEYWKYWHSNDRKLRGGNKTIKTNIPIRTPVSTIRFQVVDEHQFGLLDSQYFHNALQYGRFTNQVLLFLPPVKGVDDSNMMVGDNINFGRVDNQGTVDSLENAKYLGFNYIIGGIVRQQYSLKDGAMTAESSVPTIVLTEEAAKKSGIFYGYQIVDIDSNDKITADTVNAIKNIAARTPNSTFFSTGDFQARNMQLRKTVNWVVTILCLVIGGFGAAASQLIFFTRTVSRKQELGLYQALGMRNEDVAKSLYVENTAYLLLSIALGAFIVIISNIAFGWGFGYLPSYLKEIGIISAIILVIGQIGLIFPIRSIMKQSIGSMISYNE